MVADGLTIEVNGVQHVVQASPDTPLLYVMQNELQLKGALFGCGLEQCGSCAVLLDGKRVISCVTPACADQPARHHSRPGQRGADAWFTHHGGVLYALIAVEVLIGLAALVPRTVRFSAAAGIVLAAAIWLVPENFGQIPSGRATDPNSAPLIALMAIALIASCGRSIGWPLCPGTRGLPDDRQAGQQEPGVELTP